MASSLALVPLTGCPRCGGCVEASFHTQLPLFRHGGYGAALRWSFLACPRCRWIREAGRQEVNPRLKSGHEAGAKGRI